MDTTVKTLRDVPVGETAVVAKWESPAAPGF